MNRTTQTVKKNHNSKKAVSALNITSYLLSLDPKREYFSNSRVLVINEEDNYKSNPVIGNFRLNKHLQIMQALYYSCYGVPLFRNEIKAFEHGGVVPFVYHSFRELCWELDDLPNSLDKKQKDFIDKVFCYLKNNYTDSELRELAHEDLAWQNARRKKLKGGSDTFVYDNEVLHYYQVLSRSLLTAMRIKC